MFPNLEITIIIKLKLFLIGKISDIKDEEDKKLENAKKVASWRRIARAIEHNDFYMKRLSFSQNKRDNEKFKKLNQRDKDSILHFIEYFLSK